MKRIRIIIKWNHLLEELIRRAHPEECRLSRRVDLASRNKKMSRRRNSLNSKINVSEVGMMKQSQRCKATQMSSSVA